MIVRFGERTAEIKLFELRPRKSTTKFSNTVKC